jgi:hypothetical protein
MYKTILVSILLTSCLIARGQDSNEKASLKSGNIGEFFGQNIRFPESLLGKIGNYNVILSFVITTEGTLDSVKIISSPDKQASFEAVSSLDKSDGLWNPAKMNGQPTARKYLASFKFVTSKKYFDQQTKAEKLVQKGDYKKALELIDDGLKFHEYDKDLYQLRLKIHKNQDQLDLADIDLKKISEIDNYLMIDLWVTAIGIPRR